MSKKIKIIKLDEDAVLEILHEYLNENQNRLFNEKDSLDRITTFYMENGELIYLSRDIDNFSELTEKDLKSLIKSTPATAESIFEPNKKLYSELSLNDFNKLLMGDENKNN